MVLDSWARRRSRLEGHGEPMSDIPPGQAESLRDQKRRVLDRAADRFVRHGYAKTAVQDLVPDDGLTHHIIYRQWGSKAGLLVEVISRYTSIATTRATSGSWSDYVVRLCAEYRERFDLRALVLEGAAAARRDTEVRARLRDQIGARLREWIGAAGDWEHDTEVRPEVDPAALMSILWAAEFGLGGAMPVFDDQPATAPAR